MSNEISARVVFEFEVIVDDLDKFKDKDLNDLDEFEDGYDELMNELYNKVKEEALKELKNNISSIRTKDLTIIDSNIPGLVE